MKKRIKVETIISYTLVIVGLISGGFIIGDVGIKGVFAGAFLILGSLIIWMLEANKE